MSCSKRKNRLSRRQEATKECLQKVVTAIQKMRVDIVRFFMQAARKLQVSLSRAEREAAKFKRVNSDGLDRHRGYKIPEWVLAFVDTQTQATPEPTAA